MKLDQPFYVALDKRGNMFGLLEDVPYESNTADEIQSLIEKFEEEGIVKEGTLRVAKLVLQEVV